jgi:prevent-host-death family protein
MAKRDKVTAVDKSVREARQHFADVLYDAAAGKVTYITSRGRRIAAVVPVPIADDAVDAEESKPS